MRTGCHQNDSVTYPSAWGDNRLTQWLLAQGKNNALGKFNKNLILWWKTCNAHLCQTYLLMIPTKTMFSSCWLATIHSRPVECILALHPPTTFTGRHATPAGQQRVIRDGSSLKLPVATHGNIFYLYFVASLWKQHLAHKYTSRKEGWEFIKWLIDSRFCEKHKR